MQQQHYPTKMGPFKGWSFTSQEKGWIDDAAALEWLHKVFLPNTGTKNNERRLLIVDGHGSHTTDEYMWVCFQNNIQLLYLPAHSSHVLQPLDLSVFSPLKRAYRKELNNIPRCSDSTVAGRRIMLICYKKARDLALRPENCTAGWHASGLWPVNKQKPLRNPLVLKNSNKVITNTASAALEEARDAAHQQ